MTHLPTDLVERLPSLSRRFKSVCSSDLLWKALYARDFPSASEGGIGEECTSGARGAGGMASCGFKEAYDRQRERMRSGNELPAFHLRSGNELPAFPDISAADISAAAGARQGAGQRRDGGIDFAFRDLGVGNELEEIISGARSVNSAGNHGLGGGRGIFFGGDGAGGVDGLNEGFPGEFGGFTLGGGFRSGGGEFEGFSLGSRESAVGLGGQFVRDVPVAFGGEYDRLPFTVSP